MNSLKLQICTVEEHSRQHKTFAFTKTKAEMVRVHENLNHISQKGKA